MNKNKRKDENTNPAEKINSATPKLKRCDALSEFRMFKLTNRGRRPIAAK